MKLQNIRPRSNNTAHSELTFEKLTVNKNSPFPKYLFMTCNLEESKQRSMNKCTDMLGLVSGRYAGRNIFCSSYISAYVERDMRGLSGTADALKFNRFVTAAAARCSQLLNYRALADDADIDIQISKAWINIPETPGVIFLPYPYPNNVLKRTVKTTKLYFYDTGLVCYFTCRSSPEVAETRKKNIDLGENSNDRA